MINNITLKIGDINIPQKQIAQGLSMLDALDETLDTATVIIVPANRQEVFPMWENVWLTIGETKRSYMISEDSVDIISKQPILFKHTVQLIEPTKYLDVIPCDNLTFTKPSNQLSYPDDLGGKNASLWHVLRRIRMCAKTRLEGSTEPFPFEIDPAVEDELKGIEAPQFFLNVGNVHDAVNQVFKYINAVARCWIADDGTLMLTFDRFNKRNKLIPNAQLDITRGYILNYGASQSIQDYASEVQTYVSNLTTDSENADQAVIVYPGPDNWASVRAEDDSGVLTTANMCMLTPSPIYNVIKLELWAEINEDRGSVEGDITNFLVTKEVYKSLPIKTDWGKRTYEENGKIYVDYYVVKLGKDAAICYEYLGQIISGFSATYKIGIGIFSQSVIDTIVSVLYMQHLYIGNDHYGDPNESAIHVAEPRNILYRITFGSTIDSRFASTKDEISTREAMINVNQSTNLTDNIALGQNMQGLVQRLGQDERLYTARFNGYQYLWNLGDYTEDGYIVTKRGISIHNDAVIGNMTLNKNFNRRSQFLDLDSEIRQFVIPAKENSLTRHSLIKQYVYFGIQEMEKGSGYLFSDKSFGLSLTNIEDYIENYNPNVFMIQSDDFSGNIVGAVDSKSFGNSIAFTFGFNDNRAAGNKVYDYSDKMLEEAVLYTNNGALQKVQLQLANRMLITDSLDDSVKYAKQFPLFTKPNAADLLERVITSYYNNKIYEISLYKDPAEIWRCTAQIHFLQDPNEQGEFIFGNAYAENHLWIQQIKDKNLYLYSLPVGKKFQLYDMLTIPSDATRIGKMPATPYNWNSESGRSIIDISNLTQNLEATQSWCIGNDTTKELYLAYNPAVNAEVVADKIYMTYYGQKIRGG